MSIFSLYFFFFQAEDGIRDSSVTGVQTCALPISRRELRQGGGDVRGLGRGAPGAPARGAAPRLPAAGRDLHRQSPAFRQPTPRRAGKEPGAVLGQARLPSRLRAARPGRWLAAGVRGGADQPPVVSPAPAQRHLSSAACYFVRTAPIR